MKKSCISLMTFTLTCVLCLSLSAETKADDPLPAGFIAIAPKTMTWNDATAFCASKGGRLPLFGGSKSLTNGSIKQGPPIDGFGSKGAKWPSGLPVSRYWTGTEHSGFPGRSWVVFSLDGVVVVTDTRQSGTERVVCVP